MKFIILNPAQREVVMAQSALLNPRLIDLGDHAGHSVLHPRVLADAAHEALWPYLGALPQTDIETETAWLPQIME